MESRKWKLLSFHRTAGCNCCQSRGEGGHAGAINHDPAIFIIISIHALRNDHLTCSLELYGLSRPRTHLAGSTNEKSVRQRI